MGERLCRQSGKLLAALNGGCAVAGGQEVGGTGLNACHWYESGRDILCHQRTSHGTLTITTAVMAGDSGLP